MEQLKKYVNRNCMKQQCTIDGWMRINYLRKVLWINTPIFIFTFSDLAACLRTLLKDLVTIRDSAWRIIKSTNNMTQCTSIAIPITKNV